MSTVYNHIANNRRRTWLLIFCFVVLVVIFGYALSYVSDNPLWLFIAAVIALIQPLISYWYSDKIVLAISGAKEVSKVTHPELFRLVENLCITAGLPLPKIYFIQDSAPNAFATGRNAEHAAVVFTTGLLSKLNKRELEGVVAHELSHVANRDIQLATLVAVLVGVVVLLADWFWHISLFGGVKNRDSEHSRLDLLIGIVALLLIILAPLFAQLIQLAVSRKREFLADSSAALLTRDPEGLASALRKISQDQEPLEAANRATAHLYIASPLKGRQNNRPSLMAKLFMTHPPVEERVKALLGQNA